MWLERVERGFEMFVGLHEDLENLLDAWYVLYDLEEYESGLRDEDKHILRLARVILSGKRAKLEGREGDV